MSHTLTRGVAAAARPSRVGGAARTYWNPYAVGFLLGLVLLATYMVAGRGLGATAAFAAVAAWLTGLVSPEQVQANAVHVRYWNEGAPLQSWTLFLLVGCTSGQALTGGAMLNVGSLVFMGAVFASAYALAWFVRKEWL